MIAGSITIPTGSPGALNKNYNVTYPSTMTINTFQVAISMTQLVALKDYTSIDVRPKFSIKTQYYFLLYINSSSPDSISLLVYNYLIVSNEFASTNRIHLDLYGWAPMM